MMSQKLCEDCRTYFTSWDQNQDEGGLPPERFCTKCRRKHTVLIPDAFLIAFQNGSALIP